MTHYNDVKAFMETFGQSAPANLTIPPLSIIQLRLKLILEEFIELAEAVLVKERVEGSNVNWLLSHLEHADGCIDLLTEQDLDVDLVEVADAITDIDYVNTGAAVAFGFNLDDTFDEVHRSNMSKLGLDGKPIYNEFGKVQKGPNYFKPNLDTVLYPENGL